MKQKTLLDTQTCSEELEVLDLELKEPQIKLTKNNHPTVKPIKLMEYLVKLVSKEGAVVLDPFLGSGTTAIACVKLNRKFIGIEKEEEYVKIAQKRIMFWEKSIEKREHEIERQKIIAEEKLNIQQNSLW